MKDKNIIREIFPYKCDLLGHKLIIPIEVPNELLVGVDKIIKQLSGRGIVLDEKVDLYQCNSEDEIPKHKLYITRTHESPRGRLDLVTTIRANVPAYPTDDCEYEFPRSLYSHQNSIHFSKDDSSSTVLSIFSSDKSIQTQLGMHLRS